MKVELVIFTLVLFVSCRTKEKEVYKDLRSIGACMDNWVDSNIHDPIKVEVILFDKRTYMDIFTYPCLVIGVTNGFDTIALIDKKFSDSLIIGQRITLVYEEWNVNEKENLKPLTYATRDRRRNSIYCKVKTLFRGSILP